MQLDLFRDSRDVMLRNDVVDALRRREAAAARAACGALRTEFPDDDALPAIETLLGALDFVPAALPDHDAVRAERERLDGTILPAALRLFGARQGPAWLAPLWIAAARAASALSFKAARCEDHAAPLLLRAGEWAGAAAAVHAIESWRRIPAPLAWMIEARWRQDGIDAVWPLLAELAWLAPARFDAVTARLCDPMLAPLRKRFDARFEGDGDASDLAWFPAWLLTEKPALAPLLAQAQPSRDAAPERALRLLVELLGLERQGRHHEIVERRKALRDTHGGIYEAYMSTR